MQEPKSREAGGRRERRRVRLSDATVRSLPPGDGRPCDYSDLVRRGLRLRVSPSGERTFVFAYRRPKDGLATKYTLGSIRDGMTLSRARAEVADLQADIRKRIDPANRKREEREHARTEAAAVRFAGVVDGFAAEELPRLRPATRKGWQRYLDVEIKPALGAMRPEEITGEDLAGLVADIKARGSETSARRCYEVVRRLFAWAATTDEEVALARRRHGLARLPLNPCATVGTFRRKTKPNRATAALKPLTDDQLRAVLDAPAPFGNVLRLVAYTGVRFHDARAARWADVDTDKAVWTIRQHKTSDAAGAFKVPLSAAALDALTKARESALAEGLGRSPWVFPAPTGACEVCEAPGHYGKNSKDWRPLKTSAGIEGRGLLHRFRDTIRTRMSEHGVDDDTGEMILGHTRPGIGGTYNHAEKIRQRREALEWWSEELARILGTKPKAIEPATLRMAPGPRP